MLEIFDDSDSTRIRRSIFIVSFAIVAISHFNVTLELPTIFRPPENSQITVPPEKIISGLWWLNTYLICRHIVTEVSLWLQNKAATARVSGLEDRAKKIDEHLGKISVALSEIASSIDQFEEVQEEVSRSQTVALEEASAILGRIEKSEDYYRDIEGSEESLEGIRQRRKVLTREISSALDGLTLVTGSWSSPLERQNQFIDRHLHKEMFSLAQLTSFELEAEGRSVGGLGFDRFWFANGVVGATWIYASFSTGYGILNVVPLFVLLVCLQFLVDPLKLRIGK